MPLQRTDAILPGDLVYSVSSADAYTIHAPQDDVPPPGVLLASRGVDGSGAPRTIIASWVRHLKLAEADALVRALGEHVRYTIASTYSPDLGGWAVVLIVDWSTPEGATCAAVTGDGVGKTHEVALVRAVVAAVRNRKQDLS